MQLFSRSLLLAILLLLSSAPSAHAQILAITHITVIDVRTGATHGE